MAAPRIVVVMEISNGRKRELNWLNRMVGQNSLVLEVTFDACESGERLVWPQRVKGLMQ